MRLIPLRLRRTPSLIPLALLAAAGQAAQQADDVFVPASSMESRFDIGFRAHTNHLVYAGTPRFPSMDNPVAELLLPSHGPVAFGSGGPAGFHPIDISTAYMSAARGSGTIAIVDAYHYPTSLNDFNTFSAMFGLPTEPSTNATASTNRFFQVVYASGAKPSTDGGWSQEMALDIEWAHAMAPGAKIVLVEAPTSSFSSLLSAVQVAAALPGVTQVSMSWGGSEFGFETWDDSVFVHSGVTFFAASGDVGGSKNYPGMSPNVVAVGGTSLSFSGSTPVEKGWSGSGGGASAYEARPSCQSIVSALVGAHRGAPDIAAVADPHTGVAVYDSTAYGGYVNWFVVGGTSVSTPICAGIANADNGKRGGNELAWIYGHSTGFRDITSGSAGGNACKAGWDFVTGYGSPKVASSL